MNGEEIKSKSKSTNEATRGERREEERREGLAAQQIFPSPWNRKHFDEHKMSELVESVRKHGILQDVIVRPLLPGMEVRHTLIDQNQMAQWDEVFEIIAGERRWRAAMEVGVLVPAKILSGCTDEEAIELQAIENLQREDPNPIETGEKYAQLLEVYGARGLGKEEAIAEICAKLEVSRSGVYEGLRLLKLPDEAKKAALAGRLPASHAGLIAKLEHDREIQLEVTRMVLKPTAKDFDSLDRDYEMYDVEEEAQSNGGILPFRALKEVVKAKEEFIENRAKYRTMRDDFDREGKRVLSSNENEMYVDDGYGGRVANLFPEGQKKYVFGESQCHLPGANYREYSKLWKKAPAAILAQTPSGKPALVYDKAEADAAVKAGGKLKVEAATGGRASSKSAADVAQEKRHKARVQAFGQALELVMAAEAKVETDSTAFWEVFLGALLATGHADASKRVARLLGGTLEGYGEAREKEIKKLLGPLKSSQLRGVALAYIVADSSAPSSYDGGKWSRTIRAACERHKIDLAKLEAGEAAEETAKGAKSAKKGAK